MSGSRPTVGIRVSAEGADEARRKIEAIGPAGDAAMRRLGVASAAAAPEMQRLATASDVVQRSFVGMGGTLGQVGGVFSGVSGVASGLTAGLLALGAAAGVGLTAVARAGDAATATLARLSSATGSLAAAQAAYEGLYRLSQQTGIAVTESAGAFARFSVAAKEIGGTNDQVLRLVAGIQKAGLVAGASAQEAGAAVQQLGQALASGTLQGDELRSVLENMPQLGQALARELGVGIGQLRQMGSEGKLTADTVFPALLRAAEKMGAEFDKLPPTMGRAFGILGESMVRFGADLDKALGLSQAIAAAAMAAANAVNGVRGAAMGDDQARNARDILAAEERIARLRGETRALGASEPALTAAERRAQTPFPRDPLATTRSRLSADGAPRDASADRATEMAEAEASLQAHYDRRFRLMLDAQTREQVADSEAAQQAREAARVTATIRLKDTAADLDARYKARQTYEDRLKKLAEDEKKGGTLPAGVTFDALRKAALEDYNEALKKVADSEAKAGAAAEKAAEKRADVIEKLDLQIAAQEAALAAAQAGTLASRDAAIALETEARIREAGIPGVEKRTAAERQAAEAIGASVAQLDKLKAATKSAEDAAKKTREWHEKSWNEVANIGERAFDRLANSIVDAFVTGQGAAVNFGNITRGILGSIIADIAKLGVVNPILNSLFTTSNGARPTLGGAGLGLGDVLGLGNLVGGESIGSMLGLTGGGGLLGSTIINGLGSATPAALGALGGAYGPASLTQLNATGLMGFGGSGATLGGLLGGAGAGFGAGMLLNSLLGGNQTGGMIGSGGGAIAGALIGSIVPGIGTLLGGLLGGAAGGGLGGLIGPGESVRGWSYALRGNGEGLGAGVGNQLQMTDVFFNESGRAQFDAANQSIAQINEFLSAQGLTVRGARAVAGNKDGPDASWGGAASFGEALADLRFGSSKDARLDSYLTGKAFDDPAKLAAAVQGFNAAAAAIDALGAESVPAFTASLKAINDNFDAAAKQARDYGLAEDKLTAARATALAALEAQRAETLRQSDVSLEIRRLSAAGSSQDADLARQAESARLEVERFAASLDALALGAEDRAARLVALEEVQAAERAEIIARYGEQAAQALRQAGAGIRQYLDGLATGTAAGASPTDRLAAAQAAFDRDRTLSMGGDRDALGRVTQSADALLSAGRDVYASGAGFQAIRGSVTGGLSALPVLQSYDAMMAGSLAAIQAAITAGTLNTSTTILPSGNLVQIAGGLQLGGVEAALAAIDAELAAGNGMVAANLGAANAHLYFANEIGVGQHASIVAAHASLVALHATQVAMHESIVALHATGTAAHATAVQMEGALYALGGIQMQGVTATATAAQIAVDVGAALGRHLAASNDLLAALAPRIDLAANDNRGGLAALATIAVDASAASAQGFAATNTILADSFAALGTIAADSNAALVTSIALSNTLAGKINADTGAARSYLSFIDNTLRALSNYTLDVRARLDAGNTLAADASAGLVASFAALNIITADASRAATLSAAAMNTILVDSSAATVTSLALANTIAAGIHGDTMALRSYSAFIDNTLKAANNYAIEQTAELRGLRQQINELKAGLAALTGAVQQGAVLTATETRAVGVAVSAGADLVNDTLRKAAA